MLGSKRWHAYIKFFYIGTVLFQSGTVFLEILGFYACAGCLFTYVRFKEIHAFIGIFFATFVSLYYYFFLLKWGFAQMRHCLPFQGITT